MNQYTANYINTDSNFEIFNIIDTKKTDKYHQLYCGQNLLKINPSEIKSPFCYPVLFENTEMAGKTAEKTKKEGLTIYRYWDNLPENYNEYKFYKRLVAIPLDY